MLTPGAVFAGYRIEELIGEGGMDLALFNVYVTWPPDHTVDDLYTTFFLPGITCS